MSCNDCWWPYSSSASNNCQHTFSPTHVCVCWLLFSPSLHVPAPSPTSRHQHVPNVSRSQCAVVMLILMMRAQLEPSASFAFFVNPAGLISAKSPRPMLVTCCWKASRSLQHCRKTSASAGQTKIVLSRTCSAGQTR